MIAESRSLRLIALSMHNSFGDHVCSFKRSHAGAKEGAVAWRMAGTVSEVLSSQSLARG
jgi:hypothetical protein